MHISFSALRVSGGLLLLIIALQLLAGKEAEMAASEGVNVALVPLGTPLLGGPGTIVAVMLSVEQAGSHTPRFLGLVLALVAVALVMYTTMRFSPIVSQLIGDGGVMLVTRIAGVLLAAISIQMIFDSIQQFVTDWGMIQPPQ